MGTEDDRREQMGRAAAAARAAAREAKVLDARRELERHAERLELLSDDVLDAGAESTGLHVAVRRLAGIRVVAARGEVDLLTAPGLSTPLLDAIRRTDGPVVLDMSETSFMDSSGLHVLLNAHGRLRDRGRRLAIVAPEGAVRSLLELAELVDVLDVYGALDEALRALPSPAPPAAA